MIDKIYIVVNPCTCNMDCTGWNIEMIFQDEQEAIDYVKINYGTSYKEYDVVPL